MIAIIEYNAGNSTSVKYALNRLGVDSIVTSDAERIQSADKVIFPGVGEAKSAMKFLKQNNLHLVIPQLKQPVLGICLGMQLLCASSEEGNTECLNIINSTVKAFPKKGIIPHMGWNNFEELNSPLFTTIQPTDNVYFVHSYFVEINDYSIATTKYIVPFSAAIQHKNFYGAQFHVEKSGPVGEAILLNFLNLQNS